MIMYLIIMMYSYTLIVGQLIFGAPDPLAPPAAVPSPRGSKGRKGKRASLIKSLDAIKGKSLKSAPIWKSMDENRDQIGFGPVRMNGLTRPNILSVKSIKVNTSGTLVCRLGYPTNLTTIMLP